MNDKAPALVERSDARPWRLEDLSQSGCVSPLAAGLETTLRKFSGDRIFASLAAREDKDMTARSFRTSASSPSDGPPLSHRAAERLLHLRYRYARLYSQLL